jgi:RHS repeat-associated protein
MRSNTYSAEGDLLAVSDTKAGVTKYRYDPCHRVVEETVPGGPSRHFEYDAAGNLVLQPGLTEVVMDKGNRIHEANGDHFTYNDRDHISLRQGPSGTTRYEYNDLDMLIQCHVNGEQWTASYDAYCRRVKKTWRGQTTTYYWDDVRLAAEVRHHGSLRLYLYADEVALVPFMFVEYSSLDSAPESGQCYYIFTNQIGVPMRVEDDTGKPCWSARIDPYGQAHVAPESTLEMPLRFPGHFHDQETGLHYNRFRYFSPELGRFLQSDPVGLEGGINLYAYSVCPLTGSDIDGLGRSPGRSGSKGEMTPPPGFCPKAFKKLSQEEKNALWEQHIQDRMAALGINPNRRGIPELPTGQKKAFDPNNTRTIGANIASEGPGGGIQVGGGIFNKNAPKGVPQDKWDKATPSQRADAVIIHEDKEMDARLKNDKWPKKGSDPGHDQAVQEAPKTTAPIDQPTRDILQGQKDVANAKKKK